MRYWIDASGSWSGGGNVVLNNLRMALAVAPHLRSDGPDGVPIVPRNVPARPLVAFRAPFVWMPQNAWPYLRPRLHGFPRQAALRATSEIVRSRAVAMIRISESLPKLPPQRPTSPVLHNVLDESFEALTPERVKRGSHFVAIGSAHPYRNLGTLVRAHERYVTNGGGRELRIIASPGDPHEERRLGAMLERSSRAHALFRGLTRAESLEAMATAHAVVFPSLVEASPVTLLEARAVGARTVISDISPHMRLKGVGSIPFPAGSVEGLELALHAADEAEGEVGDPLEDPDVRRSERRRWTHSLVAFLESLG